MGFRRAQIKNSQERHCCYCKREVLAPSFAEDPDPMLRGRVGSVEHKLPRVKGGTNAPENLLLACQRCNSMRGHLDYDLFKMFAHYILEKYPNAPNVYLRGALQQFVTSLAEIAIRNKRESRRAIGLTLLKLNDDLKRNHLN